MKSEPFLQFEHPLTSDAVMEMQVLANLADDDPEAKRDLEVICNDIAIALSAARARRQEVA